MPPARGRALLAHALVAACATVSLSGCGGGDGDSNPNPMAPGSPGSPSTGVSSFTIGGQSQFPGQNTRGLVSLAGVAASATNVTISSSDVQAVSVPPVVTIAAGASTAVVPILTRRVTAPATVTITAAAGGTSRSATVRLEPGPFLSFASWPDDWVGQGDSLRATADEYGFNAHVDHLLNLVTVSAGSRTSLGWSLRISAPPGEELRSGASYGGTTRPPSVSTAAGLDFDGFGRGCGFATGSFTVLEVQYGPGPSLERLHAEFTQFCDSHPLPMRGAVYVER